MSELDAFSEAIFNRSAAYRGQSVGGNITGALGAQPGNSNTVGGGQQVIATSSDIDAHSQLDTPFSVNNIPDDPKAYISSDKSEILGGLTGIGTQTFNITSEVHAQTAGTTSGTKTIALNNTGVSAITLVTNSGATITYSGVGALPSGAGWFQNGDSISWTNGSYASYIPVMASGWVPSGSANFYVNYSYVSTSVTVTNNNVPASTPLGIQEARLGNAGQSTQAGSSFGGWDITR